MIRHVEEPPSELGQLMVFTLAFPKGKVWVEVSALLFLLLLFFFLFDNLDR